jgi:hypothetical protein
MSKIDDYVRRQRYVAVARFLFGLCFCVGMYWGFTELMRRSGAGSTVVPTYFKESLSSPRGNEVIFGDRVAKDDPRNGWLHVPEPGGEIYAVGPRSPYGGIIVMHYEAPRGPRIVNYRENGVAKWRLARPDEVDTADQREASPWKGVAPFAPPRSTHPLEMIRERRREERPADSWRTGGRVPTADDFEDFRRKGGNP